MNKATFAAGCFWGVEAAFRGQPGVVSTRVGYTGGHAGDSSYEQVCAGTTGHAEAVEVTFDPATTSYDRLLQIFWENHDPTTPDRQGPDVGTQYRSAIFYHDAAQEKAARESMATLESSGRLGAPIVTEITPAAEFHEAEAYHQQYFEKRGMGSCRVP